MLNEPTFLTLWIAAIRDSIDGTVVLLILAGGFLLLPLRSIAGLMPLIVATMMTIFLALIGSSLRLPEGGIFFALLWIPTLLLLFSSCWSSRLRLGIKPNTQSTHAKSTTNENQFGLLTFAPQCIALLGFMLLTLSILSSQIVGDTVNWQSIHSRSLFLVVFYLLVEIAPWRLFWLDSPAQVGRVFLYVAVGVFFLRGGMWSYGLFNASVKERPGSFRLKGVLYSEQLAIDWRFAQLQALIGEHWYFPIHPDVQPRIAPWALNSSLQNEGLQQAESFRRSLLEPNDQNITQAELIAQAILDFQERANPKLEGHVSLDRFQLDGEILLELIRGNDYVLDGNEAFGKFTGRWYGEDPGNPIDQEWRPIEYFSSPRMVPGTHSMALRVQQICRMGDEYRWNVIVEIPDESKYAAKMDLILGIVYHDKNMEISSVPNVQPYLGLYVGYGQLIRIMEGEIVLEEAIPSMRKSQEKYVLTKFKYTIEKSSLTILPDVSQAVYARHPRFQRSLYEFLLD